MELLRSETTDSELASRDALGTHAIPRCAGGVATSLAPALDRVTMTQRLRVSAYELLVADLDTIDDDRRRSASEPPVSNHGSRLAHAVARTTLDAWRRGEVDDENVALAYAELANRIVHVA